MTHGNIERNPFDWKTAPPTVTLGEIPSASTKNAGEKKTLLTASVKEKKLSEKPKARNALKGPVMKGEFRTVKVLEGSPKVGYKIDLGFGKEMSLAKMNRYERKDAFIRMFGAGPVTDAIDSLSGVDGKGILYGYFVALAIVEGHVPGKGLMLGRTITKDPRKGHNAGAFQINSLGKGPKGAIMRYSDLVRKGQTALGKIGIDMKRYGYMDPGQENLLSKIGHDMVRVYGATANFTPERTKEYFQKIIDAYSRITPSSSQYAKKMQGSIVQTGSFVARAFSNDKGLRLV